MKAQPFRYCGRFIEWLEPAIRMKRHSMETAPTAVKAVGAASTQRAA
jgi:hypothetical protein